MIPKDAQAKFEQYLVRNVPYVEAVHANGDLMWFEQNDETPDEQMQLRFDRFMRRYK